jgi:hypothetical protein
VSPRLRSPAKDSRGGRVPIARLVSVEPRQVRRPLDLDRGVYEVPEDFDAPLPAEVLAAFYEKTSERSRRDGKSRPRKRP